MKDQLTKAYVFSFILVIIGIFERVMIYLLYAPVHYADSGSYLRLADAVSDWNLDGYDGTRVIGYPAFLALLGKDPQVVWIVQMILGVGISLFVFWITWQLTKNAIVSFLVGMFYNLLAGMVFFESNLLTETLTAFFILAGVLLFVTYRSISTGWKMILLALATGVALSLAGLVRPLFFFLPVWFLIFIWISQPGSIKEKLPALVAYVIGPILLLGGWLAYMRGAFHTISPSAMTGYNMVQHTGGFFELLPDEYAPIRDTYIKYRDTQIAERGSQVNTIWGAIPELQEVSGLGFYDLSREMQRLSWQLIVDHPDRYLQNVVKGWFNFWKAPVYWRPEMVSYPWVEPIFGAWALIGRGIGLAANLIFILLSASLILFSKVRKPLKLTISLMAIAGMVWFISVMQTLLDHGDNPRFLIPLQIIVVLVVVVILWHGWTLLRKRERESP